MKGHTFQPRSAYELDIHEHTDPHMKPAFNPNPYPLKLDKNELLYLWEYLTECMDKGFVQSNDYARWSHEREYFYAWHLKEVCHKVFYKLLSMAHDHGSKRVTIKLQDPERKTLSIMFNRVPCDPYLLNLQERIIHQLIKTK